MKTDEFLKELTALTIKHEIEISGCGCCGSPALYELKGKKGVYVVSASYDYLEYTEQEIAND